MAPSCDLVLVVGSKNSSNSVRLVEVALQPGAKASYLIDYAKEVDPAWLEGVETVGVTSGRVGAGHPGDGPAEVARRRTATARSRRSPRRTSGSPSRCRVSSARTSSASQVLVRRAPSSTPGWTEAPFVGCPPRVRTGLVDRRGPRRSAVLARRAGAALALPGVPAPSAASGGGAERAFGPGTAGRGALGTRTARAVLARPRARLAGGLAGRAFSSALASRTSSLLGRFGSFCRKIRRMPSADGDGGGDGHDREAVDQRLAQAERHGGEAALLRMPPVSRPAAGTVTARISGGCTIGANRLRRWTSRIAGQRADEERRR